MVDKPITIFEYPTGSDIAANDTWGANGSQVWNSQIANDTAFTFSQDVYANNFVANATFTLGQITINSSVIQIGGSGGVIISNTTQFGGGPWFSLNVGNSTVYATVNSSLYTATSNNTLYVGSVTAANVVSNAQLIANLANYALLSGAVFTGVVNTGNLNVIGDLSITGNLTMVGSTVISPQSIMTVDKYLYLANTDGTPALANGAGVIINNVAGFIYDQNTNAWKSNVNLVTSGNITGQIITTSQPYVTANNSTNFGGNPVAFYANVTSPAFSANITVGGVANAVLANTTTIQIGNSTVFSTVNSTAAVFGITVSNTTGHFVGANVFTNTTTAYVGNSTTNTTISNNAISLNAGTTTGNLSVNNTVLFIGNSTVSATVNSTTFTGTSNNSTNFAGNPSSYYANVTSPNFSANITVGGVANAVQTNTTTIQIGNSTVFSTVNSTVFSGTSLFANNSTYLGGNPVGFYANVTSPNFSANITVGAVSNAVQANTTTIQIGNSTVFSTVNSTVFTGAVNAALLTNVLNYAQIPANIVNTTGNFTISGVHTHSANVTFTSVQISANGAVGVAGTVLTSGGAAGNVYWSSVTGGGPYGPASSIAYNNAGAESGDANLTWSSPGTLLTVGNSTVNNQINSIAIILGTSTTNTTGFFAGANSFVNTTTQYVGNSTVNNTISNGSVSINAGTTTGNLTVNTTALFIGNSTVSSTVNSTAAVFGITVSNTTGHFVGANVFVNTTTAYVGNSTTNTTVSNASISLNAGTTTGNLTVNNTTLFIGNSTVSATVNSTVYSGTANNSTNFAGNPSSYYANVTSPSFSANISIGANVYANLTTIYIGNSTTNTTISNASISLNAGTTTGNLTVNNTTLFIGNSTVSATVNSTVYSGTANNALNLGGVAAASYLTAIPAYVVNTSGNFTIAGVHTHSGNTTFNANLTFGAIQISANGGVGGAGQVLTSGGSGTNVYWSTVSGGGGGPFGATTQIAFNNAGSEVGDANLTWQTTNTLLVVGNSTVNVSVNSIVITAGGISTINGTSIQVGANSLMNSTTHYVGNSTTNTTIGNNSIALNAGTTVGNLTVNNTTLFIGNSTVSATVNSTVYSGTANNSTNFGGNPVSFYANVTSPSFSANISIGANVYANLTTIYIGNSTVNNSIGNGSISLNAGTTVGNLTVNNTTLFIGNSTVSATVNSTVYSGTANNALNLGGVAAASYLTAIPAYVVNTSGNFTIAGVHTHSANITLTSVQISANGAVGGAGTVLTSGGAAGNVYWSTISAGPFGATTQIAFNNAGTETGDANLTWLTASALLTVGNSTVNNQINSTAIILGTSTTNTTGFFAGANSFVNTTTQYVGNSTVNNSIGNGSITINAGTTVGNLTVNTTALFIGNSTVSSTVNSTAAVFGITVANTTGHFVGANVFVNTTTAYVGNSTTNTTISNNAISLNAGTTTGNLSVNNTVLFIGNSTVSATVNSTVYSGTANNATNLGGSLSSAYALLASPSFTTQISVGANVIITYNQMTLGNSTVNTTYSNGSFSLNAGTTTGNLTVNNTTLFIGNSTVSATVNSTIYSGTANNSTNFAGNPSSFYANVTSPSFSANISIGANVYANLTTIYIGNSTTNTTISNASISLNAGTTTGNLTVNNTTLFIGNSTVSATVNSTIYSQTANNALNLGGVAAASYLTAIPAYVVNTSGNFTIAGVHTHSGNTTFNANLTYGAIQIIANGGVGGAGQVLTSGGSGTNVYWSTVSGGGGGPFGATTQIAFNNAGSEVGDANLTWQTTNTLLTIGNSTVNVSVNSIVITAGGVSTINGSTIQVGANSLMNTTAYFVSSNVVVSGVVNTTQNTIVNGTSLDVSYWNGNSTVNTYSNAYINASTIIVGNSVSNTVVNSSAFYIGTNALYGNASATFLANVVVSGVVNTTQNTVVNATAINLSYWNGNSTVNTYSNTFVNASLLTIGNTSLNVSVNSTVMTFTGGQGATGNTTANSTAFFTGNSTVGTIANSSGLYFTGSVSQYISFYGAGNYTIYMAPQASGGRLDTASDYNMYFTMAAGAARGFVFKNLTTLGAVAQIDGYGNYYSIGNAFFGNTTATVSIGNSTVNSVINSVAAVFGTTIANTTGFFAGANAFTNTTTIYVGNSTTNTTVSNASVSLNAGTTVGNLTVNNTTLFIGNSTVSATVNSTVYSGTANNATNFGGNPVSFYANVTNPIFTTNVSIGANVYANLTTIYVGNSTVNNTIGNGSVSINAGTTVGNLTINTTALFIGNSTVSSIHNSTSIGFGSTTVNTTGLYATYIGIGANVVANVTTLVVGNSTTNTTIGNNSIALNAGTTTGNLTVNNTTLFIGNSTVSATVNSTIYSGTANNALYLGGVAAASYLTAIPAYVVNTSGNFTIAGVHTHSGNTTFNANLTLGAIQISANGGVGGAGQVLTSGGTTTNVYWSTLTAGPVGSTTQIAYNNAGVESGDANLTWLTASALLTVGNSTVNNQINSTAIILGTSTVNTTGHYAGANVYLNTTTAYVGNSTTNTTIGNNSISLNAGTTVGNLTVNNTTLFIGNSTVSATVNSTVYTGTANNATSLGGSLSTAYALLASPTFTTQIAVGANVIITYNQMTLGNSTVNTTYSNGSFSLNAGTTVGNLTVNNTTLFIGNSTVSSTVNSTASVFGITVSNTTGHFVGANVFVNTTTAYVGNSTTNTTIGNNSIALNAGTTVGNLSVNNTTLFIGNSTVSATVNSTVYSGTANNALYLGGVAAASYLTAIPAYVVNTSGNFTIAGVLTHSGNTTFNSNLTFGAIQISANGGVGGAGQVLTSGGSGTNVYWSTVTGGGGPIGATTQIAYNNAGTESGDANLTWLTASALLTVGNSTVNNQINSTAIIVGSSVTNTTGHFVGANVSVNTTALYIGNATANAVYGNGGLVFNTTLSTTNATPSIFNIVSPFDFAMTAAMHTVINGYNHTWYLSGANSTGGVIYNNYSENKTLSNFIPQGTNTGYMDWYHDYNNFSASFGGTINLNSYTGYYQTITLSPLSNASVGAYYGSYQNVLLEPGGNGFISNAYGSVVQYTTGTGIVGNAYVSNIFNKYYNINWNSTNTTGPTVFGIYNNVVNQGNGNIANVIFNVNQVNLLSNGNLPNYIGTYTNIYGLNSSTATGTFGNVYITYVSMASSNITGNFYGSYTDMGNAIIASPAYAFYFTYNTTTGAGTKYGIYVANESINYLSNTLQIGGTNVVINTTTIYIGNSTVNTAIGNNSIKLNAGTTIGNLSVNNTVLFIGNSTVSSTVNSTAAVFGIAVSNTTGHFVGANVFVNTTTAYVGNSTTNTTIGNNSIALNAGTTIGNLSVNNTVLFIGNSTVSATVNSTASVFGIAVSNTTGHFVGANVFVNTTTAYVGNSTTNTTIGNNSIALNAGTTIGNLSVNNTVLFIGNSTVSATVNSTVYSGTANNATNLGGVAAASYLTAIPAYVVNTSGNFTIAGVHTHSGNTTFNANLTLGAIQISANGGVGTATQVLTSGGPSGNVYWSTASGGGGPIGATTQIAFNNAGTESGDANLTWLTASALLTVGNSTVNTTVNSTVITVAVANNKQVYANGSLGTATQVLTSGGPSGNVYWSTVAGGGGGGPFGSSGQIAFNNAGSESGDANLNWSTTAAAITIGNSTVNTVINTTAIVISNGSVTNIVNSTYQTATIGLNYAIASGFILF